MYGISLIDDYHYYHILIVYDENYEEDIIIKTLQYASLEESIHTYRII